ncbi:MAG: CPBP family intramembrane metalloprotease [Anaerolineales bacterium]|nr:CPBP family intramembrane metalloprotease [Anaerolineales bacterium]
MKTINRIGPFLLFLACGLLVFLVFSYYFPLFERPADIIGRIITAAVFLAASLFAYRSERFNQYWLILFAFFTALTAISIDYYFSLSKLIIPALNIVWDSPTGWAIEKLESSLLSIVIVLAITRLAGQSVESLYIRRGNLQLGLIVGFIAFAVMTATVIPVTEMYFKGQNLSWARILPWTPWVLIFVLANASNEELLFRGLFIGKVEPFFGKFATNILTTIPFVLMHSFTSYSLDNFVFLALQLLPLSLAWCWLMQKSNSIWGSILFHAAMDIPIVVGIFSGL